MVRRTVSLMLCLVSTACVGFPNKVMTTDMANQIAQIEKQEVLENLEAFATNEYAIPSQMVLNGTNTTMSDQADLTNDYGTAPYTKATSSLGPTLNSTWGGGVRRGWQAGHGARRRLNPMPVSLSRLGALAECSDQCWHDVLRASLGTAVTRAGGTAM